MARDFDALTDILEAARRIAQYVQGMDSAAFEDDSRTQDAVVRCLEIIGEATKRLSHKLREQHTELPWQMMAGMRDVLIHEYDKVDAGIVWETATTSIPTLIAALELLVAQMGEDDEE